MKYRHIRAWDHVALHLLHVACTYRSVPPFQNRVVWSLAIAPFALRGIAVSGDNEVFVTHHTTDDVRVYSLDGVPLRRWGGPGQRPGQFLGPNGIAVTKAGEVVVADTGNSRIQIFRADGTFLRMWGKEGWTSGFLKCPSGVAVSPDDEVFVSDHAQRAVQVFRLLDGAFARRFTAIPIHLTMDGIYFTREAAIVLVYGGMIRCYRPDGTQLSWHGDSASIADLTVWLLRGGSMFEGSVPVPNVTSVAVSRSGRVVVLQNDSTLVALE